jgi:uncharacterized protein YjiS (DUF1127 family)
MTNSYIQWRNEIARMMQRELLRMTDRELCDCGVTRSDIEQMAMQEVAEISPRS